jgi:hypothetical protein
MEISTVSCINGEYCKHLLKNNCRFFHPPDHLALANDRRRTIKSMRKARRLATRSDPEVSLLMTLDDREQLAVGRARYLEELAPIADTISTILPFLPNDVDDDARRQLDVLASFVELPDTLTPNQLMIQRVAETSQHASRLNAAAHLLDLLLVRLAVHWSPLSH